MKIFDSIRLLSILFALSASAAIETAPNWTESEPPIRFKSRDWADAVLAAANTNDAIAVEGGRLLANTTWDSAKIHLVFNTVYVPSGVTLTISEGAVVKFCPGTMIKVEDGGKLNIVGASGNDVILTAANDATVGEAIAGLGDEPIAFDGIRLQSSAATFTDNCHLETRGFNYGAFPTVSVLGAEAVRNGGVAYVPFTLSGSSRETAFSIEWEAIEGTAKFGEDYTLASGTISWAKSSEGTKTLQIPLNAENTTGEERTFTVRIKAARCSNIGTRTATVKIVERDALTLDWAPDWAESEPSIRFKSRDWADAVLAAASTNDSIAIEGGRLLSNATWDATNTHLIFNTVYVPSGVTLTISAGAVVKFCPGTMIKVEDGGKLNIVGASGNDVILTAANDATAGEVIAGLGEESFAFDGIRLQSTAATFTDNGWLETRGFNYGAYPSVTINDSTAFRSSGLASIPVTISGTRDQTLTIDWVAEDDTAKYGEDYTLASGRITWSKASEGTKTISIPLVTENIAGSNTTFRIKVTVARGVNIARGECVVTIRELDTIRMNWGSAESEPAIRFKSRDWADAVLAAASTNDAIAVEGGRLLSNTTWDSTKTHLVFNTVYVPSGITLTISAGAIVKFCPGTMIKVEDGGKLSIVGASGNDVILTAANDATVGEAIEGLGEQSIAFDGIRLQSSSATFTDNGWLETRGFSYGSYPSVTLHDATANRKAGMVYLPVTVGGTTRNQSFTVDWVAEDESAQFGRDYATHNSGRLTWSKSGDGTKYIKIPLVTTETAGSNRTFKVRFVVARGVNVTDGEATVTIAEFENGGITSMEVVEHAPSEASPEFTIDEGIGIQPIFLNDVERVQYSGKWQTYDKNEAVALRVIVESDNGVKILKETTVTDAGAVDLKIADYPVGCYTLKHEIINDLGETLATMSKIFSVADEEDVELHGGTLTQNEVWSADKVHVVYQTVYVPSIYTLFIEPGAIVKFMTGTGIDISQGGALFANKIVFTHINDDTIGGDTLSDGYTVAPPMDAYTLSGNFTFGDDTELRGITQNTALTGTISTRKVLSRGSTYRVSGTLTVANGGSLTIPPGTVLKMESGASIVVNSGATLTAVGTRAAPIIITSIKDDSVSGDTNGDGDKTIPQPGDWEEIKNNGGTVNLAFVSALYGGYGQYSNQGDAIIRTASGTTTMDCCVVMHSNLRLIGRTGGTVRAVNCILQDGRWGIDGAVTFVNGVIADCNTGANGATVRNSILWECDTYASGGAISDCVCWGVDSSRPQSIAFNEASGNIWGDPLFVNPDNGDFRIEEGSPCVDAADSSVAPEFDYYGQPRITVTEQGTNTVGQLADIGICEVMPRNVTSDIDLVPQNVRTVTNAVPGELLFVKWEVKNAGGNELEGAWRDTVSLVSNNGREIQLGVKTTSGVIAPGGSIFCSGYFTIPPISEGEWYPKVNVNSYRDVFEGALGVNNALVGDRALTVMAEALDPTVAREGVIGGGTPSVIKLTFGADDENRMVQFDLPAGVKVTWGFGFMPQGASQSGSMTATDGGVMFRVPEGATDVYVVLESDKTATYEMTTESTKMVITEVTPNTLPASGTTTLTITGAGFGEANAVLLSTATDSIRLQSIAKDPSGNLIATVDCSTLTAGATYGVRVESGEKTAALDGAVTVTKAEGKGHFWARIVVPESVRQGRMVTCYVEYGNDGNANMPCQIIQIVSENAMLYEVADNNGARKVESEYQFIACGDGGSAGILCPGHVYKKFFILQPTGIPVVKFYSSYMRSFFDNRWKSYDDYMADISMAATSVGLRGGDSWNFDVVHSLALSRMTGGDSACIYGVVSKNQEPLPGVSVIASNDLNHVIKTITDANGKYAFSSLADGIYTVRVDGYEKKQEIIRQQDVSLDFAVGELNVAVDVYLEGADGGAEVIATSIETGMQYKSTDVNDKGCYKIIGLPDGLYKVTAHCGLRRAVGLVMVDNDNGDSFICLGLEECGSVSGRVTSVADTEATFVTVYGDCDSYIGLIADDGSYSVDGLTPGMYVVSVAGIGYENYISHNNVEIRSRMNTVVDFDLQAMPMRMQKNVETYSNKILSSNSDDPYAVEIKWWQTTRGVAKDFYDEGMAVFASAGPIAQPDNEHNCPHNMAKYYADRATYVEFSKTLVAFIGAYGKTDGWKVAAYLSKSVGVIGSALSNAYNPALGKLKGARAYIPVCIKHINQLVSSGIVMYSDVQKIVDSAGDVDKELEYMEALIKTEADAIRVSESISRLTKYTDQWMRHCKKFHYYNNGGAMWNTMFKGLSTATTAISKILSLKEAYDTGFSTGEAIADLQWGTMKMREMLPRFNEALSKFKESAKTFNRYDDCCLACYPRDPYYEPIDFELSPSVPTSLDPNEMSGPLGLGDPNTERFVKPGEWMTYTVYFENMTNATAAAQEVYVTNPLSEWLDWSTFEMGEVSFGNQIDLGLSGKSGGTSEATMKGTNFVVRTQLEIEPLSNAIDGSRQQSSAIAKWYLRIVDPSTNTGWPNDPVAGFLPPNNPETHCGEGHLTYRIKLRDDAPSGIVITNSATIVFDYNEPITTDPAWWNTVMPATLSTEISPDDVTANEGESFEFKVFGGNLTMQSSVQVQLAYNTAAAADINLKELTIDGAAVKNAKFPLILTWAAGEIGEKTISIPVAADKATEADEFFTLQIADPKNMSLGDVDTTTVTIHDPSYDALKAKVDGGTATSKEITEWTKLHPGKRYVRPLAAPATGGKVSGGALVQPGKKASLKATANAGYVFAGWYTNAACAVGQELTGYGDYRNPALSYVASEFDVDIFARFIPIDEDFLSLAEDFLPAEIAVNTLVSNTVPVESASLPSITVSGLPSGLKFYAKETVVKATKTTPTYTIPANTIYGVAPSKPTAKPATVTVTVKNAGKYAITRKYSLSVIDGEVGGGNAEIVSDEPAFHAISVGLSDDFAGKVTGAGVYQTGKKVTVKATTNKGYVFSGWYDGESLVSQAASYAFTMPDVDVALAAKFITSAEDAASVSLGVDALGGELEQGAFVSVTNMCGVELRWSISADALSQPTVAVSGLPAGLKFTAKDILKKGSKTEVEIPANTVYGAPTAESKLDAKTGMRKPSVVNFTVTTAGKSKVVYPVEMTILPLPDWAVGTFNGGGELGQVSLTVAKTGKVSGKYLSEGLTWSLSAASFDSSDDDVYRATLIGKSGKLAITNAVEVSCDAMGGIAASDYYIAFQNNWKLEPWKTVGKPFAKAAALEYEDTASINGEAAPGVITLKFAASGAVTAKGSFVTGVNAKTGKEILYSASGSAMLSSQTAPDENGAFEGVVFVYFPPKSGKFDGYVRCLTVRWDGEAWAVVD